MWLTCEARDEAGEAATCAVGQAEYVDGGLHCAGGDVHDPTETPRGHAIHRCLDQLDGGEHVGVQCLQPIVAIPIPEVAGRWTSGVVHQDVCLGAGIEHRLADVGEGDIAGDATYLDAWIQCSKFAGGLLQRFGGTRVDHQIDAFPSQGCRATFTKSLAGGADDRPAPRDSQVHNQSPASGVSKISSGANGRAA
ncbi:hypothetical protein D9M68_820870 [compost metagenome]